MEVYLLGLEQSLIIFDLVLFTSLIFTQVLVHQVHVPGDAGVEPGAVAAGGRGHVLGRRAQPLRGAARQEPGADGQGAGAEGQQRERSRRVGVRPGPSTNKIEYHDVNCDAVVVVGDLRC